MQLQYLVLYNIGPFRGRKEIDLRTDRPGNGFAFFAENNRGKTSIYNAMRWCLFGEVAARARTVNGEVYGGGVLPMVGDGKCLMNNHAYQNDDQQMEVMILATTPQGDIVITRTAKSTTTFAREDAEMKTTVSVKIGSNDSLFGREGEEAIQQFFPRELERFFFIDGEALEEYTEMMQTSSLKGLKDEVNAVLGIPAMTRGDDDLSRIRESVRTKIGVKQKAAKAQSKAQDDANNQKLKLEKAIKERNQKEALLNTVLEKLEQTEQALSEHKEIQPLIEEKKRLEMELELNKETLSNFAKDKQDEAKTAWKILLWNRAEPDYEKYKAQQQSSLLHDRKIDELESKISEAEKDLKEMTGICNECGQPLPDLEKFKKRKNSELRDLTDQLKSMKEKEILPLDTLNKIVGDLGKLKPEANLRERVAKTNNRWKKLVDNIRNLQERIKNLDEKVDDEAQGKFAELSELRGRQQTVVANREAELKFARTEVSLEETELRRLERLAGKSVEDQAEYELDNLIGALQVTVKDTIASYREEARKEVQARASSVFKRLNNAPDVYTNIRVDKGFKTEILNSKGGVSPNPSSGAIAIMTMSVIDALRHVSGMNIPVFLDTPGRSLDEQHKQNMLEYFWKTEGQQFLIFAHSGEYEVEPTVERFNDQLAKAFTLSLPGDHKTCYVAECKSENVDYDVASITNTCNDCGNTWDITSDETLILEVPL
jgi:DNA sulfur modification protein DndD